MLLDLLKTRLKSLAASHGFFYIDNKTVGDYNFIHYSPNMAVSGFYLLFNSDHIDKLDDLDRLVLKFNHGLLKVITIYNQPGDDKLVIESNIDKSLSILKSSKDTLTVYASDPNFLSLVMSFIKDKCKSIKRHFKN